MALAQEGSFSRISTGSRQKFRRRAQQWRRKHIVTSPAAIFLGGPSSHVSEPGYMNIHIGPSRLYEYSYGLSSYYKRYSYTKYARYTLGRIVCMVFRSCLWCNGLDLVL